MHLRESLSDEFTLSLLTFRRIRHFGMHLKSQDAITERTMNWEVNFSFNYALEAQAVFRNFLESIQSLKDFVMTSCNQGAGLFSC
jgi:hypothetical protein